MSKYIDDLKIKSVAGLGDWFKLQLALRSIKIELECVKNEKGILIFWAIDNKLHKHFIPCPFIYCLQEEYLTNAINEILASIAANTKN